MFALVDCNNFYASCERVFRPDLNGKPVVVLSNNDGCVIARSNEAKKLNIPMGAPAFQYQKLFDENGVYTFSSNFALYGDMSSRVMSILSTYAPQVEIYSIDEAFLCFDGFELFDLEETGKSIRKQILKWTGIPVSIGFAETKALAKIANRIAKKFPERTTSVYVIDSDEKRKKALKWLSIEEVWGVGRQHSKRLKDNGVRNAWDFVQMHDHWIKKNMSIVGLRLKKELEGERMLEIESVQNKKSIATTRSFDEMYTTLDQLRERIVTFSSSCAEKLRDQKTCCNTIMVFIHTNFFREDLPQCNRNAVIKLPYPTNSSIEIAKFAIDGLQMVFVDGYKYKKAGVIAMDITPENSCQLNIFENSNPKHKSLMTTIDNINKEIGNRKVMLAAEDPKRKWKMRQEHLSPRYTTKLDEVITINTD